MNVDTEMDWWVWDGQEAIIFNSVRTGANGTVVAQQFPVATAVRHFLTKRELAASGGVYTGHDRHWFLPQALLPTSIRPKPADFITDSQGENWTILDDSHQDRGGTWKLTCRNLILAWQLNDTINIERAAISFDLAGAQVQAYPTGPAPNGGTVPYPNLRCRVQPEEEEIIEQLEVRGAGTHYRVIVAQQLIVDVQNDRINWQGTYLQLEKYINARRIDELPQLLASQLP